MEYLYPLTFAIAIPHETVGGDKVKRATFYDLTDGKITGTLICSEPCFEANVGGKTWIEGTYDLEEYYVVEGIATLRPSMGLTVTGSIISGIPQGATVILDQQSFIVDDGVADIEGYAGKVKITLFPYLDAEVTL